jgi:hypothetical protein
VTRRLRLKSILLYVLLVGLPSLGIIEVLRAGENLKPPIFLGGVWSIQVNREAADVPPCGDLPTRFDGATLTVSQSGSSLILTLGGEQKTTLAGEVRGLSVVAGSPHQSADQAPASDDSASIYFQAQVDRRDHLRGVLKLANCPALTGLPFTATRLPPSKE